MLNYQRADGERSQRTVRPLGLVYWGQKWTLIGWCQLRKDYREFRLDRIEELNVSVDNFESDKTINLENYLEILRLRYGDDC